MQPVISKTREALGDVPLVELAKGKFNEVFKHGEALVVPWRKFLLEHSGDRELETFRKLTAGKASEPEQVTSAQEPALVTALGAFVLSEIKKGFVIAFLLLIPFFVIDLIVGNLLVALGLTMMSPSTVSLPLKLLLFVSSDGWLLLAKSLISAYR